MRTKTCIDCIHLMLMATPFLLVALGPEVYPLHAASLGRLSDGREYVLNEIHFALKPESAAQLSPADARRRPVDQARVRTWHRDILQIKGGQSPARAWIEGRPLPERIRLQSGQVPRIARSLTAVLKPQVDAAQVVEDFRRLPEVEWASLNFALPTWEDPNDPEYVSQWAPKKIMADDAWDIPQATTSLRVAVVDTGVDLEHPEFSGIIAYQNGFGDFENGDAPPDGRAGAEHGTHVAGIIAALRNNSRGIAGLAQVRLLAMGCATWSTNAQRYHIGNSDDAINEAIAQGAAVINCSFGLESGDLPAALVAALDNALEHDVLVIVAAGNSTNDVTGVYWDQHDWPVIVSATDENDALTRFSNFGIAIDLSAPGDWILSTVPIQPSGAEVYLSRSGTSMAAPHVAGAAAMVKSMNPALLPASSVKSLLNRMAVDLGPPGKDPSYGLGRLEVHKGFLEVLKEGDAFVGNVPLPLVPQRGDYLQPYQGLSSALQKAPAGATLILNGGGWTSASPYPAINLDTPITLTALPDQPVVIGP